MSKIKQNKNSGITLIALIITIIVMLILVTVTIRLAINGRLFGYAGNAVRETQEAKGQEEDWTNVDGLTTDQLIEKYTTEPLQELHNWTQNGNTFTCSHCNIELQIGQKVNYTPDTSDPVVVSEEDTGLVESTQTFTQQIGGNNGLEWVILGFEDTNGNDTKDTVLITSRTPTSRILMLYGAAEYNNGPTIMNNICRSLYSSNTYGEARSMTVEDVNNVLGWTDTRGMYYDIGGVAHKLDTKTKFSGLPTGIRNEIIANGTYTPDDTSIDNYDINGYSYYLSGNYLVDRTNTSSTDKPITQIGNDLIFGDDDYFYWLASRGAIALAGSRNVTYGSFCVGYSDVSICRFV